MHCRRLILRWLGVWLSAMTLASQTPAADPKPAPSANPARVPLEQLPADVRDRVKAVVDHASLTTRGPVETFTARAETYNWLLDHPDQTARLWRMLGAKCAEIQDQGDGRFGWNDDKGSGVHWDCVLKTAKQRVWYAEGQVKPGLLLPSSPVRAVVVLNLSEERDLMDRPVLRHQVDLMVRCDGTALAVATRIFGASAPRTAELYVGQIEMFFAALAWYLDDNPRKAQELFDKLLARGDKK